MSGEDMGHAVAIHRHLADARRLADGLRHDERSHRLAMAGVAILESYCATLMRAQEADDVARRQSRV